MSEMAMLRQQSGGGTKRTFRWRELILCKLMIQMLIRRPQPEEHDSVRAVVQTVADWGVSSPAEEGIEAAYVDVASCCSRSGLPHPRDELHRIGTELLPLLPSSTINLLSVGRDVVQVFSLLNEPLEGFRGNLGRHWVNSMCFE